MGGRIDNGPIIWILLIVGAIAYLQYHKLRTGENLLALVSPMVWWYLGALAVVVVGGIAGLLAGEGARRRELRSFAAEGSTIVVMRGTAERFGGALLVALGTASLVFGMLGRGWGWGTVAAGGVLVCAVGLLIAGHGRRWVLAKDQVRTESLWYAMRTPRESWTLDVTQPRRLALATSRVGGAFGQPSSEHYRVLLDERPLYAGTDREQAEAFLEAARQAYPGARPNAQSR